MMSPQLGVTTARCHHCSVLPGSVSSWFGVTRLIVTTRLKPNGTRTQEREMRPHAATVSPALLRSASSCHLQHIFGFSCTTNLLGQALETPTAHGRASPAPPSQAVAAHGFRLSSLHAQRSYCTGRQNITCRPSSAVTERGETPPERRRREERSSGGLRSDRVSVGTGSSRHRQPPKQKPH